MIVPAVHDRACGHRGLLPAGRTFPARPATLQFPAPVMAAGGADEAVGPAPGGEMPGTGGFIGKARLEGGAGHGAVIVPAAGHHETLHEHPADAHQKLNISSNRAQRDKPFTRMALMRIRCASTTRATHGTSTGAEPASRAPGGASTVSLDGSPLPTTSTVRDCPETHGHRAVAHPGPGPAGPRSRPPASPAARPAGKRGGGTSRRPPAALYRVPTHSSATIAP